MHTQRNGMSPYVKAPKLMRYRDGGHLNLGPVQFNWGYGNGEMPRGLRIHVTWPVGVSVYLFGRRQAKVA